MLTDIRRGINFGASMGREALDLGPRYWLGTCLVMLGAWVVSCGWEQLYDETRPESLHQSRHLRQRLREYVQWDMRI